MGKSVNIRQITNGFLVDAYDADNHDDFGYQGRTKYFANVEAIVMELTEFFGVKKEEVV